MSLRNRSTHKAALFIGVALLLLPACGGGGGSDDYAVVPLNAAEKELVGEYRLADFRIREVGCVACTPEDFEVWGGRMELRADRTATVAVELCEDSSDPTVSCDREFIWTGDAGLIVLHATEAGVTDVRLEWLREGMGSMTTDSVLPTNEPDSGLLLLEDGQETFRWERIQ